jgi:hypothetical protein
MTADLMAEKPENSAPLLLAASIAILIAPLLMFLAAKGDFTGLMSDTPIYVLLADHFSPYYASTDWFSFLFARYPFPPLYPIVLGLLGGGSQHIVWTHLIGALTICLCAGTYCYWLLQQDWPNRLAVPQTLVFVLMPITLFTAIDVLSEPLYLLLTLLGLIFIGRDDSRATRWYAAAFVIGLAALVRTVGITGVAAFILYWWLQTRATRCRGAPFLALLPTLMWAGIKQIYEFDSSYVMSVITFPLLETLPALLAFVPGNIAALWEHGVENVDLFHSVTVARLLSVPLLFALLGLLIRLRDGRFDAIYVVLYGCMIVIWPHGEHAGRFLFCLVPLILFYLTYAADRVGKLVMGGRAAEALRLAPLALIAALALPGSALIVGQVVAYDGTRYSDYVRTDVWFRQHSFAASRRLAQILTQMLSAIRTLGRHVEPEACITSVYPHHTMLLTLRRSMFPDTAGVDQAAFEQTMRQCRYVLILNATNDTFGFPVQYYPYDRLGDSIEVIDDFYYDIDAQEPVVAAILARYLAYPQGGSESTGKMPGR